MLFAKAIPLIASTLFIWKITEGEVKEVADEFWRMMKFDIPLNKIKVEARLVSPTIVKADLVISNNYKKDLEISDIVATLYTKNSNNELVELARTPPNNKSFTIKSKSKTTIPQFPIEVSLLKGLRNIQALLNKPQGERILIKFSLKNC